MQKKRFVLLWVILGCVAPVFGADPVPTPYPTAAPYPCTFPYGVTIIGKNQPSNQWAYESPVSIGLTGQLDQIHVYAPEKGPLVVGLYDEGERLMKAVTLQASGAGWQTDAFPVTVKPGLYYLAQSGSGSRVNLVAGAGVSCFSDTTGTLGPNFQRSGSLLAGLPIYVTGCPPQTIQGFLFGIGDSVMGGAEIGGGGKSFMELLTDWLNQHYGPVQRLAYGANAFDSSMASGHVDFCINNRNMALCILEIGMNNLEHTGGSGSSRAARASVSSAFSSALIYGADVQDIISAMKAHMPPNGILLVANLYETKDFTEAHLGEWKDYEEVLQLYNRILAMVAEANNVKVIDLYSLMASNPAYRDPKNMHPNSAGHAAIALQIEKAIVEAGMPPSTASPLPKEKK